MQVQRTAGKEFMGHIPLRTKLKSKQIMELSAELLRQ
jgi:hypothetical protein